MKYLILFCIIHLQIAAFSQNAAPCDVSSFQSQIDSVKAVTLEKGFTMSREAIMPMESQYEMPIIGEFSNQKIYKIYFIAQPDVRLLEMRIYDHAEREVTYQKKEPKFSDLNIIEFDFVPKFSELHMIRLVQAHANKKVKNLCGYVVLFEYAKKNQ